MNNEIQLSSLGQSLPMQPGMPGAGGGLGGFYGGGGAAPPEVSPFKKLHRLMRGRYMLAIGLGFVGAAAGAVAGYISQKPAFKSDAQVEITPVVQGPRTNSNDSDKVMAMFSAYVNAQIIKLQSDKLVREAMQDPRWQKVRPGPATDAAITAFGDNLTVALAPRTNTMINISYSDNTPDSKLVAPAAVQSLLKAYWAEYEGEDALKLNQKVKYWEEQTQLITNEVRIKQRFIEDQSKITDGDPNLLRSYETHLSQLESERDQYKNNLEIAKKAIEETDKGIRRRPTPEDWGRVDETMAIKLKARNDGQLIVRELESQLGGPNHPTLLNRKKELQAIQEEINAYAAELDSKYVFVWKPDGAGGTLLSRDIGTLQQLVDQREKQRSEEAARIQIIRQAAARIATAKDEILQLNVRSSEAGDALRDWKYRKDNISLSRVIGDGSVAKADKDRRPIFAAIGFMGGAGVPIGLLLLFGLFDTRYRYSDDTGTGGSGIGGLTLLGILPNLPDRLSDPEQAAIAAHCVHQIRTMLQINTGMEDRRIFAVTSASPGDGKTSLTLALGLSYAACGTRTLLIDCDLIGSGLSSRMNVSAPEGVLEAISNRSLMPFIRETDVNDVSILPVGSAGNMHASTLSPQALRRLIEEAEQHFDVVLIDTGPILGSIEASLVCAAADAVILTVARGQQRPMVERSLGHLSAIGARLAGVVFNRAQSQDFERSISGVSMRSVGVPGLPRGTRPTGQRLGPVARAVQSDGAETGMEYEGEQPVE